MWCQTKKLGNMTTRDAVVGKIFIDVIPTLTTIRDRVNVLILVSRQIYKYLDTRFDSL